MQASSLIILLAASILALLAGQVFIAAMLFFTLIVFLVFFALAKTASGAKETVNSLTHGTMTELEKAKGQNPKGTAEIGKIMESLGSKTGEITWAKDKEKLQSPDIFGRLGTGSKNLLDGLGRLFK